VNQLQKHDINGKEAGSFEYDEAALASGANAQMVKDYIVAIRANLRQWSANTKGRSEVKCTGKKPFKQKGTGNARQGSLAAPQFKGGGVVFGPKPKFDQKQQVNKKEKKASIRTILKQKIDSGAVLVVDDQLFHSQLEKPNTKLIANFIKKKGVFGRRLLFVLDGQFHEFEMKDGEKVSVSVKGDRHEMYKKSLRNLPKAEHTLAENVNGYELLAAYAIVFTESAFLQTLENVR